MLSAGVMQDAQVLWDFHQMPDEGRATDIGIGLGSHDIGAAEHAADLYQKGRFPVVIFTGANAPTTVEQFPRGEAVHFADRARELGVPLQAIIVEPRATNTSENFRFTRDLLAARDMEVSSAMIISRPYQQRRAWAVDSPLGAPRAVDLPLTPISLILQYKRPEFLRGARAKQWPLWNSPYYRFTRDPDQHAVLKRLEINLVGDAIVRYAAPAFHTMAELDQAQLLHTVIKQTGHVSPAVLAHHRTWTYQAAGQPGRGNPAGPWRPFDRFEAIFEQRNSELLSQSSQDMVLFDGLERHLRLLAEVAGTREPLLRRAVDRWRRGLLAVEVPEPMAASLADFVTVRSILGRIGAGSLLADGGDVKLAGTNRL